MRRWCLCIGRRNGVAKEVFIIGGVICYCVGGGCWCGSVTGGVIISNRVTKLWIKQRECCELLRRRDIQWCVKVICDADINGCGK